MSDSSDSERPKKHSALLNKLRKRFASREEHNEKDQDDLPDMQHRCRKKGKQLARPGNTNAMRSKRKIQIGLKIDGKHIRKEATGGGKREVSMRKSLGRAAIMERAKAFFFPEGNRFGPVEDFTFNLENFEEKSIDERFSIGEMYESTGLPLLRFYLCAARNEDGPMTNSETPDTGTCGSRPHTSQATLSSDAGSGSRAAAPSELADSSTISENVSSTRHGVGTPTGAVSSPLTESLVDFCNSTEFYSPAFVDLGTPTVQAREEYFGTSLPLPIVNDLLNYEDEEGHAVASVANAANDREQNANVPVERVKLHRGHVLKELTELYKEIDINTTLEVEMIMPNGQQEPAEDNGGVLRDTLSEYWEDFYLMNTAGENVKVPFLRDNMKKEDWQACAKVLLMGYKQEGYFPYKLAQAFLQFTMDGDDTVMNRSHPSLLPTFLQYVSDSERELITDAMNNFNEVDKDDLLEVMDTYRVQRNVREDNIQDILQDAAHRTLIQAPSYICRCWHALFVNNLQPVLKSSLEDVCKQAHPTTKRVTDAIILPDQANEAERNTGKLLLKYIRSLSSEKLADFMRYTTGANLMIGQKITVRFVEQTLFERRPIAHTCGCVLELATTFKDYIEFRSEFNALLDAKIWIMDIV